MLSDWSKTKSVRRIESAESDPVDTNETALALEMKLQSIQLKHESGAQYQTEETVSVIRSNNRLQESDLSKVRHF